MSKRNIRDKIQTLLAKIDKWIVFYSVSYFIAVLVLFYNAKQEYYQHSPWAKLLSGATPMQANIVLTILFVIGGCLYALLEDNRRHKINLSHYIANVIVALIACILAVHLHF